eukprot:Pgem_evm1s19073
MPYKRPPLSDENERVKRVRGDLAAVTLKSEIELINYTNIETVNTTTNTAIANSDHNHSNSTNMSDNNTTYNSNNVNIDVVSNTKTNLNTIVSNSSCSTIEMNDNIKAIVSDNIGNNNNADGLGNRIGCNNNSGSIGEKDQQNNKENRVTETKVQPTPKSKSIVLQSQSQSHPSFTTELSSKSKLINLLQSYHRAKVDVVECYNCDFEQQTIDKQNFWKATVTVKRFDVHGNPPSCRVLWAKQHKCEFRTKKESEVRCCIAFLEDEEFLNEFSSVSGFSK